MISNKLRYLLLQVRDEDDPMRDHEVRSFVRALGCSQDKIIAHDLLSGAPTQEQLDRVDMVLLGGSGDYHVTDDGPWAISAMDTMRQLADEAKPTFGSCWGFQAFAQALGGVVVEDKQRAELGTLEITVTEEGKQDPVFGQLKSPFRAVVGHKFTVDKLPIGAISLASSDLVTNHAFRLAQKPIYCTQFHPEVNKQGLGERLRQYPKYTEDIAGISLDAFMAKAQETPESEKIISFFVNHVFG